MRKIFMMFIGLIILAGAAYAYHFNVVKTAGDVTVTVAMERDSFTVGENYVIIELADAEGKAMNDADVSVYYFMPSMPAMNYETGAELKGSKYAAVIKPTMRGAWDAHIKVKKGTGEAQKVTISFDAK